MEDIIVKLTLITLEEIALILAAGINNRSDPSTLRFEDITDVLTRLIIVKRKKLEYIAKYIAKELFITPKQ